MIGRLRGGASRAEDVRNASAIGVACFALSRLSLATHMENEGTALFWLGAGLALGIFAKLPRRSWGGVAVAIFVACLISSALGGIPWRLNVAFATANVVEPLVGATLWRRWIADRRRPPVAQAVFLGLAAMLASGIGAAIGTGAIVGAGMAQDAAATFRLWYIDDLLGALLLAPLVVTWWPRSDWVHPPIDRRRFWGELALFAALVAALGYLTFWRPMRAGDALVALCLPLPLLLVGAVRLGPRGATLGNLILSLVAVLGTLAHLGPFVHAAEGAVGQATLLQVYLVITATIGLVPALLFTERAQVMDDLARREREVEEIFQSLGEAVLVADVEGHIRYANRMAETLTRVTRDEASGRPFTEVVVVEGLEPAEDPVSAVVRHGALVRSAEARRLLRHDGTEVPIAYTGAPLWGPSNELRGVVVVLSDMTERQAHAEELREAEHQLAQSQKLQAVGALAAGIAHDFNNVLAAIVCTTDLVQLDASPEQAAHLEQIQEAAFKGKRLTMQLAAFNRDAPLDLDVVDLNAVVTGMQSFLKRLLGEDIALRTSASQTPAPVLADRGQLEQILINLAVNARDAMPAGGSLHIRVGHASAEQLGRERARPEETGYGVVEVEDSGHGIDETTRARMFEPFFTTKPSGSGTGLGLATVQKICARHDGFVDVSSELGQGTTVRVGFPLHEARDAATETGRTVSARGAGEHILLVEDADELRDTVRLLLQRGGFEVVAAEGATHALELLAARRFDLLLTDVIMPVMNGKELATRAHEVRPGLRVLFMSGYSAGVLDQRVPELGREPLLRKPFTAAELTEAVIAALGRGRATRSGASDSRRPPPRTA